MTPALICLGSIAGVFALFGGLIWLSDRDGDRATDATAQVRLSQERQPERVAVFAHITVTNPGDRTILVSATSRPVSRIGTIVGAVAGAAQSRRTLLSSPLFPSTEVELLGAIEPLSTRTWILPVEHASAVRVAVRLDQDHRRSRCVVHTVRGPGAIESTPTSPIELVTRG